MTVTKTVDIARILKRSIIKRQVTYGETSFCMKGFILSIDTPEMTYNYDSRMFDNVSMRVGKVKITLDKGTVDFTIVSK